jgi:hypothetical protein
MTKKSNGRFRKGRKKTGGRKPGTRNKTTRLLKEASLIAAEAIGNEKGGDGLVGFMKWAGKKYTPNFLAFLARLNPQQVETKEVSHEEVVCRTFAEIRQDLIKGGVRVDIIHPELTDELDEIEETDETDENSGEQQQ